MEFAEQRNNLSTSEMAGGNETFLEKCDHTELNDLSPLYFAIYGVFMIILITLGTLGNTAVVLVFLFNRKWVCLNYYLIALALWDFALLLSSFGQWSIWALQIRSAVQLSGSHVHFLRHCYILGNITITGCVWVIVTLTIERFFAIVYPLKHRTMDNNRRAKALLLAVSIGAVGYNVARPFELEVVNYACFNTENQLGTIDVLQTTALRANWFYFFFYRVIGSLLFIYLVPCVIMTTLTTQMLLMIHSRSRPIMLRSNSGSKRPSKSLPTASRTDSNLHNSIHEEQNYIKPSKADVKMNRMLFVVLFKFVFCYALPAVIDILEIFLDKSVFESRVMESLIIISNSLVVFNSSCNFFIYLLSSSSFRQEFLRVVLRRRQFLHNQTVLMGLRLAVTEGLIVTPHSNVKKTTGNGS